MDAVAIAVIALVGTILGPLLLSYLTGRQRHRDKEHDWARQDAVAARLEQRQDAAAAKTAEVARLLEQTDKVVNGKLNQIHELVNSTLSAAMESELGALKGQLVAVRRVMAIEGSPASEADSADVTELERRIVELSEKLGDRARQTEIADSKVLN